MVIDSDEDATGGIDINTAQERMREEDKKDKEIYRAKVKAMHRVCFKILFAVILSLTF